MSHYLSEYQSFDNKYELNNAIYEHIRRNSPNLNETERSTLKAIARYAVKFAGVAHLKAETIAGLIDKSIKTARRAVNKLDELGIIEKVYTTRKVNGGKGANIIVIQPIKERSDQSTMTNRTTSENLDAPSEESHKNENEPSNLIKRIKSTKDTLPMPAVALKGVIPSVIYNALSPYFNAEELYRYYGIILKAKKKAAPDLLIEQCPEPFVESIKAVMFAYKRKKVRNLKSYFYTAMAKASSHASRLLNANNHVNIFDLYNPYEMI